MDDVDADYEEEAHPALAQLRTNVVTSAQSTNRPASTNGSAILEDVALNGGQRPSAGAASSNAAALLSPRPPSGPKPATPLAPTSSSRGPSRGGVPSPTSTRSIASPAASQPRAVGSPAASVGTQQWSAPATLPVSAPAGQRLEFRKKLVDGKLKLEMVPADEELEDRAKSVTLNEAEVTELLDLREQRQRWELESQLLAKLRQQMQYQQDKSIRLVKLNDNLKAELKDLHRVVDVTLKKVATQQGVHLQSPRGMGPAFMAGGPQYSQADMAAKDYELKSMYAKFSQAQREMTLLRQRVGEAVSMDRVTHLENTVIERDATIKQMHHEMKMLSKLVKDQDTPSSVPQLHEHILRLESELKAAKERLKQVTYLLQEQYRVYQGSTSTNISFLDDGIPRSPKFSPSYAQPSPGVEGLPGLRAARTPRTTTAGSHMPRASTSQTTSPTEDGLRPKATARRNVVMTAATDNAPTPS